MISLNVLSGTMPSINLRKNLYDELVRIGEDPTEAANEATTKYLEDEHDIEVDA